MTKINTQDLAVLLAKQASISKKEAEAFLKELMNVILSGLDDDELVKVKGIGTFKLITISERESVDVVTGNRVVIPAHQRISFTPDKTLAATINEPFALFEPTEIIEENAELVLSRLQRNKAEDEKVDELQEEVSETPHMVVAPVAETIEETENLQAEEAIEATEQPQPEVVETIEAVAPTVLPEPPAAEAIKEEEDAPPEGFFKAEDIFNPDSPYYKPVDSSRRRPSSKRTNWGLIVSMIVVAMLFAFLAHIVNEDIKARQKLAGTSRDMIIKEQVEKPNFVERLLGTDKSTDSVTIVRDLREIPAAPTEEEKEEVIEDTPAAVVPTTQTPAAKPQTSPNTTTERGTNTGNKNNSTTKGSERVLKAGERLTIIAEEEYGNKAFWIYIYEENKDKITDPNNVRAGTKLTIPKAEKYKIDKDDEASIRRAQRRLSELLH